MTPDNWTAEQTAKLREYKAQGWGDIRCGHALGKSRNEVRHKWDRMEREARQLPASIAAAAVNFYDQACHALTQARQIDETREIRDKAEAVRRYGRMAKNRELEIDATEIRIRAERRLGEMIAEQDASFGLNRGGRPKTGLRENPLSIPTLEQMDIDKNLAHRARKLRDVEPEKFESRLAAWRQHALASEDRISIDIMRAVDDSRATMPRRREPDDSLDFFPTPPWATRALIQWVLCEHFAGISARSAWEPACGEGHMSEVLREFFPHIYTTDIFDYGTRYQDRLCDFLGNDYAPSVKPGRYDWIITNPPFNDKTLPFILRALEYARVGVAMFVRSQWAVEGIERYERLFRDRAPTLCAFFVERVNLCKGRWEPDGSTLTAYSWLVWLQGAENPRAPFWIPPGCRESLTRPDDRERFANQVVSSEVNHDSPPPTATNGSLVAQSVGGGEP